MTCGEFRERVFDALEGSGFGGEAVGTHAQACARCGELWRAIRENERVLSRARVPSAPPDLWPRIAGALADRRALLRRERRAALVAAAAVLLLLIGLIFMPGKPSAPPGLELVVEDAGPDAEVALRALVPLYDDVASDGRSGPR
jgi:hypothetical protein